MFEESGGKAKTAGFRIQFMKLAYSGILPGIAPLLNFANNNPQNFDR